MAACGIAEHHEARRRQSQAERKAYSTKVLLDMLQQKMNEFPSASNVYEQEVDYMRKVGSPPGIGSSDPAAVDRIRRDQLRQQQLVEYTAKLPHRFTSMDYISQW